MQGVMIHHTAEVQTQSVGEGTSIWQHCVILKGARIGRNCNINCHVLIENDVIVGDNVTVKPGVQLWDGVRLEDGVFIGPNVTFTNDLLPRSKHYPDSFQKTVLHRGSSIGANSTILGGITIGQYAMVGAGSLVTKSIPDYTLWYGNPAVFKGYICRCGNKLNTSLICQPCNRKYSLKEGVVSQND